MNSSSTSRRRSGRKHRAAQTPKADRQVDYRNLRNPFPPMAVFSDDQVDAIHETALTLLETKGIKVLLPEACEHYRSAGATVDVSNNMVYLGRDIVEAALVSAPRSIPITGGSPARNLVLELGRLVFQPGAGAPHATDLQRGRRPGSLRDFRELVLLTQHFDVLHMVPPLVEPQDSALNVRHYDMAHAQLTLSDKVPFVFARGTGQVEQSFEIIRDFRGASDAEFMSTPYCYTIINTNSPRQIDIPMAQGLIDFAKAGQVSIVTPFTLMGAMAPITLMGSLTLSHAEALAAITLTQLVKPGAPVCYGTFTSNVDMKSGSPAFGTPEHFKASLGASQLARKLGLPWRCAGGSAANTNDPQAANETQLSVWGCLLAGATVVLHSAGWLEGGLSVSYEKLITDIEMLQMVAEICSESEIESSDEVLQVLGEVEPGNHFFSTEHTMKRYRTAFYEPLVHDWSNFGAWTERGAQDASTRATAIWHSIVERGATIKPDPDRIDQLETTIRLSAERGGALPVS